MRTDINKSLSVEFNTNKIPINYDPTEMTAEIWFRADDANSTTT